MRRHSFFNKKAATEFRHSFHITGFKSSKLFLATVAVAAHELVNATSGVDEFLFAGEEGVRDRKSTRLNSSH